MYMYVCVCIYIYIYIYINIYIEREREREGERYMLISILHLPPLCGGASAPLPVVASAEKKRPASQKVGLNYSICN